MQSVSSQEYRRMIETPIPSLIFSLALPSVLTMLSISVYNVADAFFVASLGTTASGALSCLLPLTALIQTVGFTLGMGAGSLVSRRLGEQNRDKASSLASAGFWLALLLSVVLAIAGYLLSDSLVLFLGATPELQEESARCARYLLLASPFLIAGFVLNNLLRSEGRTDLALWGIATGSLLNVALDPLFIFTFKMGVSGTQAATILSQAVGVLVLLLPFLRKKTALSLAPRHISRSFTDYGQILVTGLPSLFRQGLAAAGAILLNHQAAGFGNEAIAAMGIVNKIFMIFFSLSLGLGQGYQPAAGFNFGADRKDRLREAFLFTLRVGVLLLLVLAILLFVLAPSVLSLFSPDKTVQATALPALRALCLILPLIPPSTLANLTYQAIGRPWLASFLAASRQGLFFLPLILLLPRFFGLAGVQISQAVADLLTFLCSVPFLILLSKKMRPAQK